MSRPQRLTARPCRRVTGGLSLGPYSHSWGSPSVSPGGQASPGRTEGFEVSAWGSQAPEPMGRPRPLQPRVDCVDGAAEPSELGGGGGPHSPASL